MSQLFAEANNIAKALEEFVGPYTIDSMSRLLGAIAILDNLLDHVDADDYQNFVKLTACRSSLIDIYKHLHNS